MNYLTISHRSWCLLRELFRFAGALLCILCISTELWADAILYEENFNSYPNGTTTSSRWTLITNGADPDIFSVRSDRLEAQNTGEEVVWASSVFYITGHMNVTATLSLPQADRMESSDYIRIYYKIDGGPETLWETNGEMTGNYSNTTVSQTYLRGTTMQIIIRIKNNNTNEDHFVDNILVTGSNTFYYEPFNYPNGTVTSSEWTINSSGTTYFKVRNNRFESNKASGGGEWISRVINIPEGIRVNASVNLSESGGLNNSDYLRVYYKLNGGSETLFPVNGEFTSSFGSAVASASGLSGSTLQIIIRSKSNSTSEYHFWDNVTVTADTVPPPLAVTATGTNTSCYGMADGSIDAAISGGKAPYTFAWSQGATTEDLSGLSAGTYSLTVTDWDGSSATASVTIQQPPAPLAASLSVTHMTGDATNPNGAIDVTVSGGWAPYTFSWNSVTRDTVEDLTNIYNGIYEVEITDAGGCRISKEAMVVHYDTIKAGSYIINMGVSPQTIGNGLKPYGLVYELVKNRKVPVKWAIKPNKTAQTEVDFTHNGISYKGSAFIIDASLREATVDSVIAAWEALGVVGNTTVSDVVVPVYNTITGFSNLGVDQANENLVIPYFNNAGIPSSIYYVGLPQDLEGCDDAYILPHADPTWANHHYLLNFVKNEGGYLWSGCHAVSVLEGIYNPSNPAERMNFLSKTGLQCYSSNDCGNLITETHGNPSGPYSYNSDLASHPVMQFVTDLVPSTDNGSERMYIPLSTGGWNDNAHRAITTANGTSPAEGVKLVFGRAFDDKDYGMVMYLAGHTAHNKGTIENQVAAQRAFMNFILHASIDNRLYATANIPEKMAEGQTIPVSVTVTQGTAPYTIAWSSNSSGYFGDTSALSTTFTLPAGSGSSRVKITVQVTDACGRIYFATVPVDVFHIAAQAASDYNGYGVSCFGAADGYINLTVSGGKLPLSYTWSNGAATEDLSSLTAGTYSVTITDAEGYAIMDTFTLNGPAPLAASFTTIDVLCNGFSTGSIDLMPSGGVEPYVYSWSNTATSQDISSLSAGIYIVTITDANNCSLVARDTVTELAPLVISSSKTDVPCHGLANGTAQVSVSGGAVPYTYAWSNGANTSALSGLSGGTYVVTVTDLNNCSATASLLVEEPATLTLILQSADLTCYNDASGSVDLSVAGGTAPYVYQWSNLAISQDITNLSSGIYSVTVTDDHGCTAVGSVSVAQPDSLYFSVAVSDLSCFEANDGEAIVSVSGGVAPYMLYADNGLSLEVPDTFGDLSAMEIYAWVIDDNGCTTDTQQIIIRQPDAITVSVSKTDVSCSYLQDGAIDVTAAGGSGPLEFVWNTGAATEDLSGLGAGSYSVTVTDSTGCMQTTSETIAVRSNIGTVFTVTDVSTHGGSDGAISQVVTGGVGPYTYNWSHGATTKNVVGLSAGIYTVTITDALGCTLTESATVTQPGACPCTWIGITNDRWREATNWDCGFEPSDTCDVVIAPGTPNTCRVESYAKCKSLLIQTGATLVLEGSNHLEIFGNLINNGTLVHNSSHVHFKGNAEQLISGTSETSFHYLYIENTSSTGVRLNGKSIRVYGDLRLLDGYLFTGPDTVKLETYDQGALLVFGSNSFIVGKLRRKFEPGQSRGYEFPVGDAGDPSRFFRAYIKTHKLKGTNYLTVWFDSLYNHSDQELAQAALAPPEDIFDYYEDYNPVISWISNNGDTLTMPLRDYCVDMLNGRLDAVDGNQDGVLELPTGLAYNLLSVFQKNQVNQSMRQHLNEDFSLNRAIEDDGIMYSYLAPEGLWRLEPDQQPTGGYYDLILYITNFSGLSDNNFGVLKRPTGSGALYWTSGKGKMKPFGGEGRKVSDGYAMRTMLTTFSDGGVGGGGGSGLPIELLEFKAELVGDQVELSWITATETNNDYFTIEKSDGTVFKQVAIIPGAGTSSEKKYYSHIDYDPLYGTSYYRLKQTDFDGKFEYSQIVSVTYNRKPETHANDLLVFPNPSGGQFTLKLKRPAERVVIYLFDAEGSLVFQDAFAADTPDFGYLLNLDTGFEPGVYHLKADLGEGQSVTRKLMLFRK